jgi:LAO/AO transport system kinase
VDELFEQVRQGRRRAVARLITYIERSEEDARRVVSALYADTGRAHIVGITGAPGTGKSTLVNELAKALRSQDKRVGIVAVDPSSPFTGGAILGDRIRMRDLSGDPGIFIRSMASRGSLGGLARATSAVLKVLDAAGFDVILVETVGAGQAEVDIARAAHTTVVIEAPGMGDDIQSIKAGILEIADILVVNKADRPGAALTTRSLRMMLHLGGEMSVRHHGELIHVAAADTAAGEGSSGSGWRVPVHETVATEAKGISALVDAVNSHLAYLRDSGQWFEREKDRSRQDVTQLLQERLIARLHLTVPDMEREALIASVAARKMDPYSAVTQLFARITLD